MNCIQCGLPATLTTLRWWCSHRCKTQFDAEMTLWIKHPTGIPQRCVLCGQWCEAAVCSLHDPVEAIRLVRL
jgi:hypothetical protein